MVPSEAIPQLIRKKESKREKKKKRDGREGGRERGREKEERGGEKEGRKEGRAGKKKKRKREGKGKKTHLKPYSFPLLQPAFVCKEAKGGSSLPKFCKVSLGRENTGQTV